MDEMEDLELNSSIHSAKNSSAMPSTSFARYSREPVNDQPMLDECYAYKHEAEKLNHELLQIKKHMETNKVSVMLFSRSLFVFILL